MLDASAMVDFSQKHGLTFFQKEDIIQLWQLGFLRADLIESSQRLQGVDLIDRGLNEYDEYVYSDERQLHQHSQGWEGAIAGLKPLPPNISLLFHPFRYYVLYQLERLLSLAKSTVQVQFPIKSFEAPDDTFLQQRYDSGLLIEEVEVWNDISALIVLTEPYMYERIFQDLGLDSFWMSRGGWQELYKQINQHGNEVVQCYRMAGIERLKTTYQELCSAAYQLDPNTDIHTLVCLGNGKIRLKLEGRLGGAIYLRSMAEMLRRTIEETFACQLPEEDVGRFGARPGIGNYKEGLYGSKRLLDRDRYIANEFQKRLGLNFGFRLHWYVEGKTEWGALNHYRQRFGVTEINVVDLHGEVAQRGQRGIAFRESLRADIRMEVYSIVSIDGDVSENVRVVKKAAEDDEICGAFYIFTPDFEFANFELLELEEILWEIAEENGAGLDERERLHEEVQGSDNSEALLRNAKRSTPPS